MVFYALCVTAELENLTDLQPLGGCSDPEYAYYFKVKCENCGETSQKEACVTLSDSFQLPTGRGTANLVQKCKLCGRDGTIQMLPGHGEPLTLQQSQSGSEAMLMVFDCRGFEPIDFSFGNGWKAESTSGARFEMDLSEGEFVEYDEKGECPVGISNLRASFKVVKKHERAGKTTFV
ncbi:CXXC motif containing zinc binding protein-like [Zingiber officinale]|uniref:CXXC motif containing zinc binding protein n=1 Tax=Zingiber officinale TaxID=94328 RepID=A0A8J5C2R1_ZINOF|nr:CXXC motif containing zinc binding protein-like [Zingiber officinale]XP_042450437.1 CXXC motif containing zinc binding protein-like [Zingiber officinale]KAG6469470.1 hypothetical protein ZIOFF_074187 [Zingiber officinale]KAG6471220.1 hypothetical protein ZIOFF_072321 [Zingiber officinale]